MLAARHRLLAGLVAISSFAHSRHIGPSLSMSQTVSNSGGQMSCERFLTYDYKPMGNTMKLKDETQFYGVGNTRSKQGVILVPDTWGWNAGRIRNLADFLSTNDMYCAIPQLMGSSTEGGDSLSITESSSFGEYMKSQTFDGHLKPKISSLVKFLHSEGVEKVMIIGFSWGGWVALNVLASDIAEDFCGGILAHPSINLEERIYGGNLVDLFSRVNRPVLLMPARGDPDEYLSLVRLHKFKCPSSDYVDFHGVEHGFLLRSSIDDSEIKRANVKALEHVLSFCRQHFQMNPRDLVNEAGTKGFSDSGEFAGPRRMPSWTSWFGSMGQSTRESAERTVNAARDNLGKTGEVISDQASQTGDYLRESSQYVQDSVSQGYEKTRDAAKQTGQYVSESAQQGYSTVKDTANQAGQYVSDTAKAGYDTAKRAGEYVGDTAGEGYERAKDAGDSVREQGKQTGISIGEYTKKAGDVIWEGAHRLGETIKQTFSGESGQEDTSELSKQQPQRQSRDTTDNIRSTTNNKNEQSTTQWLGEKANEAGQYVQDSAQQGYDKAKESTQWAGEKASETSDYLKEQLQKTGEAAQDTANKGYEQMQQTGQWTKEKAQEAGQYAQDTANKAYDQAQKTGQQAKEQASKMGENAQEQAHKTGDYARDQAGKAGQSAHETARKGSENLNKAGQSVREQAGKAESYIGETAQKTGENVQKAGENVQERGKNVQEHSKHGDHSKKSGK